MITIKKATLDDAGKITDINIKAFNDEMKRVQGEAGGPPGYDSVDQHKSYMNEYMVYTVLQGDEIIGSFFLVENNQEHFYFENFCIYPEFQNKGYGFDTLELVEKEFPSVKKWSLHTDKRSDRIEHLYEKFGYTKCKEGENYNEYQKLIK